mmetsp:Transcript_13351/g.29394  ORF Transcript_13351/g.29394 Transcript_13351/m.29394 type:complete len:567 (+) Transcript_13351:132-1832(+)
MLRSFTGQDRRSSVYKYNDTQQRGRSDRERMTVEIRKNKREEKLKSRRTSNDTNEMATDSDVQILSEVQIVSEIQESMEMFKVWKENNQNMELAAPFSRAVTRIRHLLSGDNPPLGAVLNADCLPYVFDAFQWNDEYTHLQVEAAWIFTNLASSDEQPEYTHRVALHPGLVHELVRLLLEGRTPELREQCAMCLGNIAAGSEDYRDSLLEMDGVRNGLVQQILHAETETLRKEVVSTTKLLLKSSMNRDLILTTCFVKPLIECLKHSSLNDTELQVDICWALEYLAEGEAETGERANILLKHGALEVFMVRLRKLLEQQHLARPAVVVRLVRCIGNFAVGTEEQTSCVLEAGFLNYVERLLAYSKRVEKDTVWVCSNIAAGTLEQAMTLAKHARVLSGIADAANSKKWNVQVESLFTLSNLLCKKEDFITTRVLQAGVLRPFCSNLKAPDVDVLLSILDGLEVLLQYNKTLYNGSLICGLQEEGGIEALGDLMYHRSNKVHDKVAWILSEYIEPELENDDEFESSNLCPANNGETFEFGVKKQLHFDLEGMAREDSSQPAGGFPRF